MFAAVVQKKTRIDGCGDFFPPRMNAEIQMENFLEIYRHRMHFSTHIRTGYFLFSPNWKYPLDFFQYNGGWGTKNIQILEKWGSILDIVKISSMDPSFWIFFYRFSMDAQLLYWKYTDK